MRTFGFLSHSFPAHSARYKRESQANGTHLAPCRAPRVILPRPNCDRRHKTGLLGLSKLIIPVLDHGFAKVLQIRSDF